MRILVTGASGFIGRHVVRTALAGGHDVVAVSRKAFDLEVPSGGGKLRAVQADLSHFSEVEPALRDVDVVIHLAAAKSGDLTAQRKATIDSTKGLLQAMSAAGTPRLVHVSSFSVYDYREVAGSLDEDSPLEKQPEARDAYARVKLEQEELVRDHCAESEIAWTIVRPGVVFGPGNEWTARLGVQVGRLWLLTGTGAPVPLTYVENCADAILLAAEKTEAVGEILNVIDDDPPTQRTYARELRHHVTPRPILFPLPWWLVHGVARLVSSVNARLLGNRVKVPGILVPARLCARSRSLRYSNSKAKRVLGWMPRHAWRGGLERCFRQ